MTARRRGDLLDALAERSPMRRADLKVAMELVLEEMGKLLDAGDELVLPPLGKLSVKKRVATPGGGDMLTVKLRRARRHPGSRDGERVVLTVCSAAPTSPLAKRARAG
jgi:nucleoid DNA-binding protein